MPQTLLEKADYRPLVDTVGRYCIQLNLLATSLFSETPACLEHVFSWTFLLPREAPGLSAWGGRSSIIELDKSAASLKPTSFWSTLEISRRCYIIDFSDYSPYKPTNNGFWTFKAFHEGTRWAISISIIRTQRFVMSMACSIVSVSGILRNLGHTNQFHIKVLTVSN